MRFLDFDARNRSVSISGATASAAVANASAAILFEDAYVEDPLKFKGGEHVHVFRIVPSEFHPAGS